MNETYKITVRGTFFWRTYDVKGFETMTHPTGVVIILILADERRKFFDTQKYSIHFSDGWFKKMLEKVQKDAHGKAVVNHGLKKQGE